MTDFASGPSAAAEPEFWLRGPVPQVPALLQPAAHAFLQARADLRRAAGDLSPAQLWERPGGVASVGFHLRHVAGSVDRLLTYAAGRPLAPQQLATLGAEGDRDSGSTTAAELLEEIDRAIAKALAVLQATSPESLGEPRTVGRARLPTTVLGLLFHAAEHAQRHAGQTVTTAAVVRGK